VIVTFFVAGPVLSIITASAVGLWQPLGPSIVLPLVVAVNAAVLWPAWRVDVRETHNAIVVRNLIRSEVVGLQDVKGVRRGRGLRSRARLRCTSRQMEWSGG
jgi:hypothetical protein